MKKCRADHDLTPDNSYVQPKTGKTYCKRCHAERQWRYRRRNGVKSDAEYQSKYAGDRRTMDSKQGKSVVYFIGDGNGHVKIGVATNLAHRLDALQNGNVAELTVLLVIPGGHGEESDLHRQFHQHRVRGEWFRLVPEIIEFMCEKS